VRTFVVTMHVDVPDEDERDVRDVRDLVWQAVTEAQWGLAILSIPVVEETPR